MPSKDRRKKESKRLDNQQQQAKPHIQESQKISKKKYAAKRTDAQTVARRKYAAKRTEAHISGEVRYRIKASEERTEAAKRYAEDHPEIVTAAKRRYAERHPEKAEAARKKFEAKHPQTVKQSKKKYEAQHPETVKRAKKKFKETRPESQAAAQKRYLQSHKQDIARQQQNFARKHPELIAKIKKVYASRKPKVLRAARMRYKEKARDRKLRQTVNILDGQNEMSTKRLARQRRFLHLLPSREYSYIRSNRAILITGQIVAQQRMVRKLLASYRRDGEQRHLMAAMQVVQVGLNVRAARAEAVRRQANVLKEIFDVVAAAIVRNPSITLEEICGAGEHRASREPYFHDFAYRPTVVRPRVASAYGIRRAGASTKIAKLMRPGVKIRRLKKLAFEKGQRMKLGKFEMAHRQKYAARVLVFRKFRSLRNNASSGETWPCDPKKCVYPSRAVRRLAEMQKLFANVLLIRNVIADKKIDACSFRDEYHKTWLTKAQLFSDRERRFVRLPIIQQLDKKGHGLRCLPDDCASNLLFLRQLAVHFAHVSKIVRHIYLLLELDRKLCELDKALIEGDYGILEQIAKDHKGYIPGIVSKPLGPETEKILAPEDHIPFLPYTQPFQEAIMQRMEWECAECGCLFYRSGVKQIFVKEPEQRPARFRARKNMDPTLHIGGPNRTGPSWNRLWTQLYERLKERNSDIGTTGFYVCDTCDKGLRSGETVAAQSISNNMGVDEVPVELARLNEFSKLCVQRAKCFQLVCRLGTVGKGAPISDRLKVVRGQVLYYPLPLMETVKQLEQAESEAPTMHVIFNSVVTKNSVVWQQLINLEHVKAALQWLRENNPVYRNMESDKWLESINKYMADKNLEPEASESEPADDIRDVCEDLATRGSVLKPMIRRLDEGEQERILESCTVHPLEPIRPSLNDLQVFMMQKIQGDKLDNRYLHLDLACFPVLYPRGRFGAGAIREVPIDPIKYVKCRLLNKDARWRRDHQFIFNALWQYELRQVAQGINQTLRNRRRYDGMTVGQFLDLVFSLLYVLQLNHL